MRAANSSLAALNASSRGATYVAIAAAYVLLIVLSARPLIPESFERADFAFLSPEARQTGPTPSVTGWLDTLLLLAAGVALLATAAARRSTGGATPQQNENRPPRIEPSNQPSHHPRPASLVPWIGFALLVLAVGASVAAADDRRMAMNAGAHLCAAAAAGLALVRVASASLRTASGQPFSPTLRHLALAGVLAAGAANALRCVSQWGWEFEQTYEYWQEQKAALIERGVDVDSPLIVNYERRMRSRQPFGYLSHPNVTASIMAMAALLGVGLCLGAFRREHPPPADRSAAKSSQDGGSAASLLGASIPLVIPLSLMLMALPAIAIALTGSLGAMIAMAGAAAVMLALLLLPGLRARPRRLFVLLAAGYIGLIALGIGVGMARGTLPHTSMAFRWTYWTVAIDVLRESPWTGVGRENFRDAYMRYRPAHATEEVSNPHNVWMSLLVELGPLGLAGGALLLGAALWVATRGARFETSFPKRPARGRSPSKATRGVRPPNDGADRPSSNSILLTVAPLAVGVLALQGLLGGMPLVGPEVALWWTVETAAPIALLLLAAAWRLRDNADVESDAAAGSARPAETADEGKRADVETAPLRASRFSLVSIGLLAAVLAVLVHNLVDFSLLTPAGTSLLVLLAAGAAAACRASPEIEPRRRGVLAAVSLLLLAALHFSLATWPTARAEQRWESAQRATHDARTPQEHAAALEKLRAAIAADGWDAHTPRAAADLLLAISQAPGAPPAWRAERIDAAHEFAQLAARRAPRAAATPRLLARIEEARAAVLVELGETAAAAAARGNAAEHWQQATARNPADPRLHLAAAAALAELWLENRQQTLRDAALAHLNTATKIDAARPTAEAARLRPQELAEIERLRALLTDRQ